MVRLRREIEGIRPSRATPPPPWVDDAAITAALTPAFDDEIVATDGRRVLIAGVPRLDLALRLCAGDRFVTVCDLTPAAAALAHASLPAEALGRLQFVSKSYGDAAFAPSSFDVVAYFETLHLWAEPEWVAHKLGRELKVDGRLFARLWTSGDVPAAATLDSNGPSAFGRGGGVFGAGSAAAPPVPSTPTPQDPPWHAPLLRWVRRLPEIGRPEAAALLDAVGRDAVDRGALRLALTPRLDATAQLGAIASRLRVEAVAVAPGGLGELATLAAHGRGPWRALASRALGPLAAGLAEVTAEDATLPSASEGRIVTVVARRALGDPRGLAGRSL